MKINKFALCVLLLLTVFSIGVFADARISNVVLNPTTVTFVDKNSVQVTAQFEVFNPSNTSTVNTVELTGKVTGPSTIADAQTQTFSLGLAEKVNKNLVFTFPREAKQGSYRIEIKVRDVDARSSQADIRTITVNAASLLELQKGGSEVSELVVRGEPGDANIELALTLKNLGNVDFTNLRLATEFSSLKDEDEDTVTLTLSPTLVPALNVGSSATFKLTTNIQEGFDFTTLSGNLVITVDQLTDKKVVPLKIDVKPLVCKTSSSAQGLKVTIEEPDNDQKFGPEDTVKVRVDVSNDASADKRVKVVTTLFNMDKSRKIESDNDEKKIEGGEEESFFFSFPLTDEDLDEDTSLGLFVKAFEKGKEDTVCAWDDFDLDFELPDHSVIFDSLLLTPLVANCGGTSYVNAMLRNVGKKDERVTFTVDSTALGISQTYSEVFSLSEDRDEDDNVYSLNLRVDIPEDAKPSSYPLDVKARYSGKTTSEQLTLTVVKCEVVSPPSTVSGSTQGASGSTAETVTITSGSQTTPATGATVADKDFWDNWSTGSYKVPTSVWVLVDIVLVLGVISLLVFLFRKH